MAQNAQSAVQSEKRKTLGCGPPCACALLAGLGGYAPLESGGPDYGDAVDTWWTHDGHTMDTTMDTRWTLCKHDILCAARDK